MHFGYARNAFLALLSIVQRLNNSQHGNATTNEQSKIVDHRSVVYRVYAPDDEGEHIVITA